MSVSFRDCGIPRAGVVIGAYTACGNRMLIIRLPDGSEVQAHASACTVISEQAT